MLTDNKTDNLLSGYIRIIYYPDLSGYPWASLATRPLKVENRKSYTSFWLVPKLTTLDDLELEGSLYTLSQNSELTTEIWMHIDPCYCYQRLWYSPLTLVSGNKRFVWIFAGVSWKGDRYILLLELEKGRHRQLFVVIFSINQSINIFLSWPK